MANEITRHHYCSAFCEEMREDIRSRIQVIMFALSIIMMVGVLVCQQLGMNFYNEFYLCPGEFMCMLGSTGLCTIGLMAIIDVAVRIRLRSLTKIE